MSGLLPSRESVAWALITYTDWWQPSSTSFYRIPGRGRRLSEGLPTGLLDRLDVRSELCRRMELLDGTDRRLLFLWYVRQLSADEIAEELGISRRQCFRRRSRALETLAGADDAS